MSELALEIDETTRQLLKQAARDDGMSPTDWLRRMVRGRLERSNVVRESCTSESERNRLPSSFFEVLGTWEDDRAPEEILREIREGEVSTVRDRLV